MPDVTTTAPPFDQGMFLLHYNKGKEYFQEEDLENAQRELELAQRFRPDDEDVLNLLGLVYFKRNRHDEAEQIYRRLLVTNPNVFILHSNLGLILFKKGNVAEAEHHLVKATELKPNYAKSHLYLGLLYKQRGQLDTALEHLKFAGATKLIADVERERSQKTTPLSRLDLTAHQAPSQPAEPAAAPRSKHDTAKLRPPQPAPPLAAAPEGLVFDGEDTQAVLSETPAREKTSPIPKIVVAPAPPASPPPVAAAPPPRAAAPTATTEVPIPAKRPESRTAQIPASLVQEAQKMAADKAEADRRTAALPVVPPAAPAVPAVEAGLREAPLLEQVHAVTEQSRPAKLDPTADRQSRPIPRADTKRTIDISTPRKIEGASKIFTLHENGFLEINTKKSVYVKRGTVSSYTGNLKFQSEKNLRGTSAQSMIRADGAGKLFLYERGRRIFLIELANEFIFVEGGNLLAMEDTLMFRREPIFDYTKDRKIDIIKIYGRGSLAISTSVEPLTLRITKDYPLNLDAASLVAWTGNLVPAVLEDGALEDIMIHSENSFTVRFEGEGVVIAEEG